MATKTRQSSRHDITSPVEKSLADPIHVRNLGIRRVRVADLADAPWNFRSHPQTQQDALGGAIDELGFHGYPQTFIADQGTLTLYDGHLRKATLLKKYGPDAEIDVNVTDFTEVEAKKAQLTTDPLAAMAATNSVALDALLREVETGSEALAAMFAEMASDAGLYANPPEAPDAFRDVDETLPVNCTCPKCGYQWSDGK